MTNVTVVIGSGSLGQAVARRISSGRHVVLADLHIENAQNAAEILTLAGYNTTAVSADVSNRESVLSLIETANTIGDIVSLVQAAGVSPSQAPVSRILDVDLYGTAMLLEEFGKVITPGGSGIVISSQSGYRMPALTTEQDHLLATAPAEELLNLPFVKEITDTLHAYQMSKRCNSLRVRGEAPRWGARGARINAISPGIIITPLAYDELHGERAEFYRQMLASNPAKRAGTPDEVAALAAHISGPEGGYITGSDFLIDGGATANFFYGPNIN
ncbi:SDR family oxidoreductase [Gluconobacter kanchanaburiensis]|uniref:Short-chain dehydrogenase n=1 Tax=Gluconobacter kanchanaburiensis NBRC 103587 TaxID=1307948 RepID=A0A511BAN7_9PROT|nr:SDR family oxidoreductase [Gluconobacter kanchanaburiensis]MBF0863008.1 SDR family oxidoreductase [Gluconobacter kanchanaburiensis]GBR71467.1 dehydrogenase [Gluconobacter kanchanaburiensis NBRC 103587]GEK97465.1 short-chain dehydrogenase [Gluconobacter kanchanaburiensis NBRC 103587]